MFHDREDAARQLAQELKRRALRDPLVLAIPRGGVVIGAMLARELDAELDVVLARKLRAPGQPEVALGAVSESGQIYLNHFHEKPPAWFKDHLLGELCHQLAEIAHRRRLFRGGRAAAPVAGRSVIVTDDGIATGSTMIAALKTVRAQKPHELIVAVPVSSPERLQEVRDWCDEVVCLLASEEFWAVGQFYDDFAPVRDEQAAEMLSSSKEAVSVSKP